jgi:hypothetical protein
MGAPDLDAPFVVFDVASGSATAPPALIAPELMHPRPRIAAFSADGLRLAAVFANDHGAALAVWRRPDLKSPWNAPTYSWSGVVGEGLYWNEIGFQPDGGGVATFGNSRTGDGRAVLVLWRTETNAAPWIGATRSGWGDGMAVSPRGDAVAIATDDGTALFDPSTGAQTLKLPRTKVPIEGLAFSPSGDRLYAAMGRALVYWDLGPKK